MPTVPTCREGYPSRAQPEPCNAVTGFTVNDKTFRVSEDPKGLHPPAHAARRRPPCYNRLRQSNSVVMGRAPQPVDGPGVRLITPL
jgi:hypothetical protein